MFNLVASCEFLAVISKQIDNNLSKEIISYFLLSLPVLTVIINN